MGPGEGFDRVRVEEGGCKGVVEGRGVEDGGIDGRGVSSSWGLGSLGCLSSPRNCPRIMRLSEPPVNMPLMMTFSLGTPAARAMASTMGLLAMPEGVSMSHVMLWRVMRTLMRLV